MCSAIVCNDYMPENTRYNFEYEAMMNAPSILQADEV